MTNISGALCSNSFQSLQCIAVLESYTSWNVSDRFANWYRYFWKQNWSHTDDLFYPNSMKMLVCAMV